MTATEVSFYAFATHEHHAFAATVSQEAGLVFVEDLRLVRHGRERSIDFNQLSETHAAKIQEAAYAQIKLFP